MVLYINIDNQEEAYAEAEVRQSYADDMAQLAADGSAAQAPTYEQSLEDSATSACSSSTSTTIWTKSWMSELVRLSRAGFLAFDHVTFNGGDQEPSFALNTRRAVSAHRPILRQ